MIEGIELRLIIVTHHWILHVCSQQQQQQQQQQSSSSTKGTGNGNGAGGKGVDAVLGGSSRLLKLLVAIGAVVSEYFLVNKQTDSAHSARRTCWPASICIIIFRMVIYNNVL